MPNLILRPNGLPNPRNWSLQLRWHESLGPTEYYTITTVSEELARDIVAAGAATWLLCEPKVKQ